MEFCSLPELVQALPLDDAVRIVKSEGAVVFRATSRVQERIEVLLEKQREGHLEAGEEQELMAYEELDDLLSLVNRMVRNAMDPGGQDGALAQTA